MSLPLLLITPAKLALLPDILVSNNGIISLPVTAAANFRVVFLPDSLSPTSSQYLPNPKCLLELSQPTPKNSLFAHLFCLCAFCFFLWEFSLPRRFVFGIHSHLVLHPEHILLWESSSISLCWVWSCFHLNWCNVLLPPSSPFIHLLGERLLRTCSRQSPKLGVGDSEIIRIWFLPCRRPHSCWGDRN